MLEEQLSLGEQWVCTALLPLPLTSASVLAKHHGAVHSLPSLR